MSANQNRPREVGPTPIDSGAVENLQYIRRTIEAADTSLPCPARGVSRWVSPPSLPWPQSHTLPWRLTGSRCGWEQPSWRARLHSYFMEQKAHAQGLSLRRAVARRFFMTLAPAFLSGAILTAALVGRVDRDLITGCVATVVRHRPHGVRIIRRSRSVHRRSGIHGAWHGHAVVAVGLRSCGARSRLRRHPLGAWRRHREATRWLNR